MYRVKSTNLENAEKAWEIAKEKQLTKGPFKATTEKIYQYFGGPYDGIASKENTSGGQEHNYKELTDLEYIKMNTLTENTKEEQLKELQKQIEDLQAQIEEDKRAEQLKIGDYIYYLKSFDEKPVGFVGRITAIDSEVNYNESSSIYDRSKGWIWAEDYEFSSGFRWGGNGYNLGKDFRKATKEEIEDHFIPKEGDYVYFNYKGIRRVSKVISLARDLIITNNGNYNKSRFTENDPEVIARKATQQEIDNISGKRYELPSGMLVIIGKDSIHASGSTFKKSTLDRLINKFNIDVVSVSSGNRDHTFTLVDADIQIGCQTLKLSNLKAIQEIVNSLEQ